MRSEEDNDTYMRLNKTSEMECTKAKEESYEQLYRDVEENGPKRIHELAKIRQSRVRAEINVHSFETKSIRSCVKSTSSNC